MGFVRLRVRVYCLELWGLCKVSMSFLLPRFGCFGDQSRDLGSKWGSGVWGLEESRASRLGGAPKSFEKGGSEGEGGLGASEFLVFGHRVSKLLAPRG